MTLRSAGEYCDKSAEAMRMMARRGRFPVIKMGKSILIDKLELDRALGLQPIQEEEQRIVEMALTIIRRESEAGAFLYFIASGDTVKIGTTNDIEKRLGALQTSSPVPLQLLASVTGDRDMERALHRAFIGYRESGEWFRYEGPVRQLVEIIIGENRQ